ncbi:MAG: phage holin family protein [Chthoniobacterales bacterium]
MDETIPPASHPGRPESVPELLKELRDDATMLVRQEVALFKTETSETVSKLLRNLAYVGVGAFVALLGLIFLLQALSSLATLGLAAAGLEEHAFWVAPLMVGLLVTIIGLFLLNKGIETLKKTSLTPTQTIETLKDDKKWIQNKAN